MLNELNIVEEFAKIIKEETENYDLKAFLNEQCRYGQTVFTYYAETTALYDEYEAIRLLDYEGMNQDQAAVQMNVSRPTMTRIYEKARKTIAQALVEGKMIVIEGGNVQFEKQWFRCKRCFKLIGGLENHVRCKDCKTFSNEELMPINSEEK